MSYYVKILEPLHSLQWYYHADGLIFEVDHDPDDKDKYWVVIIKLPNNHHLYINKNETVLIGKRDNEPHHKILSHINQIKFLEGINHIYNTLYKTDEEVTYGTNQEMNNYYKSLLKRIKEAPID